MPSRPQSNLLLLTCSAAVLAALAAGASAGETLTMKFKAGDSFAHRITQNVLMEGEALGQKLSSDMTQTLFVTTRVKSVTDDGSADAEQTIHRAKIKLALSGPQSQTVEYDTADDEEPANPIVKQMSAGLSNMIGEAISMTISPQGRMSDLELPEKLKQSTPGGAAGPGGAGGGDQLKQMFEQSGLRLPSDEVSTGDTWPHETEIALPFGTMQISTTYTYQGTNDDGLHKIDAAMDVNLKPAENSPAKITAEAKEAAGSYLFDNDAGRVHQSTIKQSLVIVVDGQFTQNITTTVTMELIDENAKSE